MQCTTIGIDIAKSVFQLSSANSHGKVVDRNRLTRGQFERFLYNQSSTQVVMEACATAHHWARVASAAGHEVVLLHPAYVKPYVRRNKTDAADADALVRASKDPDLKPVPPKSLDQQAMQGVHRIRQQLIDTRRQRINMARALLAEFGIPLPRGTKEITQRLRAHEEELPPLLRRLMGPVIEKLMTIPGVGSTTVTKSHHGRYTRDK